ncbi:hypothetical protein [Lentzea sp. NPDC092896]|uniref:hypothetical protein n=1 Tax=Lentzea sp. NPDC092896 TaxID=3364127 RepID=UPI0038299AF1
MDVYSGRRRWRASLLAAVVGLSAGLLTPAPPAAASETTASPPAQPLTGPGGSSYRHAGYTTVSGGTGIDAWYVFLPAAPSPTTAPVSVIVHGYGDYSGYNQMHALVEHTVKQGSIVIYPRWQTCLICPLPDKEQPLRAAANGIKGALAWLAGSAGGVRPRLDRTAYFGHSFGGMITVNLANRWASLGLPQPATVMLDEPEGGPVGNLYDADLSGIPATTKFSCLVSDWYAVNEPGDGCYHFWGRIAHIPSSGKDFVLVHTDRHGTPELVAEHGMSAGTATDAIDYFAVWKLWDGLRSCVLDGRDCAQALNGSPEHRDMGKWSDGVPVTPLSVADVPISS